MRINWFKKLDYIFDKAERALVSGPGHTDLKTNSKGSFSIVNWIIARPHPSSSTALHFAFYQGTPPVFHLWQ